jgi:hypothetical protein
MWREGALWDGDGEEEKGGHREEISDERTSRVFAVFPPRLRTRDVARSLVSSAGKKGILGFVS